MKRPRQVWFRTPVSLKIQPSATVVVRPSVRLSVCHKCTVTKRCKIKPKLLLIINMKSHIGF